MPDVGWQYMTTVLFAIDGPATTVAMQLHRSLCLDTAWKWVRGLGARGYQDCVLDAFGSPVCFPGNPRLVTTLCYDDTSDICPYSLKQASWAYCRSNSAPARWDQTSHWTCQTFTRCKSQTQPVRPSPWPQLPSPRRCFDRPSSH